jgi:hypothetical protein
VNSCVCKSGTLIDGLVGLEFSTLITNQSSLAPPVLHTHRERQDVRQYSALSDTTRSVLAIVARSCSGYSGRCRLLVTPERSRPWQVRLAWRDQLFSSSWRRRRADAPGTSRRRWPRRVDGLPQRAAPRQGHPR